MRLERTRPETCLSDLALDSIAAGEPIENGEHLQSCAACRERSDHIRAEREKFLAAMPPLRVAPISRRWPIVAAATAMAASIAGVVLLLPRQDETQIKGSFSIGFYARHEEAVRRGASGEVLAPGDQIRFYYSSDRPGYLAILSVDAVKRISRYHPPQGEVAAPAAEGREVLLDSAALLDETTGPEIIHAFLCEAPAPIGALERVVGEGAEEPEGCRRTEVTIEKKR